MFARIALFLLIAFSANTVHASWVDDWVDQKTSSGGNYFESQKRGFGSFGSASMRWKVGNDHLLTVAKPQFKAGCGGIDAFLGGFSFLQFEQLVDKFEKVMGPAAAAFAFDIALSVLSEQASESIKSLTAIIDRLNQLQMEDCKAAKGITATLADGILNSDKSANDKSEAVKDFLQTSGIQDLYNNINEMGRSKTVDAVMSGSGAGSNSQMISGCSNELKSIFFTNGFILDHLGSKRGLDSSYTSLMRGMVGDVYVDAKNINYASVPACPENDGKTIDNFINGETYYREDPTSSCTQLTTLSIGGKNYSSIRDWVFNILQSAGQKVISRDQNFTADEEALLSTVPGPIYRAITVRMAQYGTVAGATLTANEFADYVAMIQVYNMLADFYGVMDSTIRLAQTTFETQLGTPSGSNQHTCKIQLAESAVKTMFEKKDELALILQETHQEYNVKLQELESTVTMNQVLAEEDKAIKQDTASQITGEAKRIAK